MLTVDDVTVRFKGITALKNVSAVFGTGGISGLIGPNGAGKTTLLNVITGVVAPGSGSVQLHSESLTGLTPSRLARKGIVRSFQTTRLLDAESVFTNILLGRHWVDRSSSLSQLCGLRGFRRQERRDRIATYEMARLLGFAARDLRRPVRELPFGLRRLVEVGRVFVGEPSVVLLDEPAAGLARKEREELATFLQGYMSAHRTLAVLIEHDVDLVRKLCQDVVVLDSGAVIASGRPGDVLQEALVREAFFGDRNARS